MADVERQRGERVDYWWPDYRSRTERRTALVIGGDRKKARLRTAENEVITKPWGEVLTHDED